MGLEDIVEDVVHRVEEAERSDGEDGHQEVAQEVFAQGEVEERTYGDDDEGYSHIGEVEGDEEVHHSCDEIHAEDSTYGVEEVAPAVAPVLGIDGVEGGGEDEDSVRDEEEVRVRSTPPQRVLQDQRPDEVHRCRGTEPHEEPREAFAEERKEEGEEDERRARLLLQEDQPDGEEDDSEDLQIAAYRLDLEVILIA